MRFEGIQVRKEGVGDGIMSRLTKLAYPEFGDLAQQTIARDTFIKGLPSEIQVELRKDTNTNTKSVQDLAAEVVRLQLAGVGNPIETKRSRLRSLKGHW